MAAFTKAQRIAFDVLPNDGSWMSGKRPYSSALSSLVLYHPEVAEADRQGMRVLYRLTKAGQALRLELQ